MDGCIFCRILKGEIPSTKIWENDRVYVFKDIHPEAPVHALVMPREHIPTLNDATPETLAMLMEAAKETARVTGIDQSGYRAIINCNKDSGQLVYHLHVHVLGGKPLGAKIVSTEN